MSAITKKKTAGQIANKALSDTTKYNALEFAHAATSEIGKEIRLAIENYKDKIEEEEFCVVMVIAGDPLIHNLRRRKFYCWPWLPSPRPNQTVFLYNRRLDAVTKRLWVLPCAAVMAELTISGLIVNKLYRSMQRWSRAFYTKKFWDKIRDEHKISMLSQQEWFEKHSAEVRECILDDPTLLQSDPFDFGKIQALKIDDTANSGPSKSPHEIIV